MRPLISDRIVVDYHPDRIFWKANQIENVSNFQKLFQIRPQSWIKILDAYQVIKSPFAILPQISVSEGAIRKGFIYLTFILNLKFKNSDFFFL